MPSGAERTVSGSPISVFQLRGVATTRRSSASIAARTSFVDVFPVEPVIPTTGQPRWRRQARASAASAASGSAAAMTAPPGSASGPRTSASACSSATRTPQAPSSSAPQREAPAVGVLPAQADEEVPRPGLARVDDDAGRPRAARPVRQRGVQQPAAGRPRDLRGVPGAGHQAGSARRASRATVASSKGTLRPPASSWPCSWPLPATTTTSPGRASSTARAIAVAAVRERLDLGVAARPAGAGQDLGDDRAGVLRARVVGGDDDVVGQRRGGGAHERALGPVAVAAGAEDHEHATLAQAAGGPQDVLERVRGVGVVDEHREGLALVDGLEAAGRQLGPGQAGRDRLVADAERARGGDRAEGVEDVEAPRQRHGELELARAEARARRARAQVGRAQVGVGALEADRHRVGELRGQAQPVLVVDVDHADRGRALE